MAAATALSEETIKRVLTAHEQNLLRLRSRGKSLGALAQMYRQYAGENGVQEALDRIAEKLRRARLEHVDDSDNSGGVPIKIARPAVKRAPPAGDAPPSPPAARPPSTSTSSSPVLRRASQRARTGALDGRVLEVLRVRPGSCVAVARELGVGSEAVAKSLRRLQEAGEVRRTGHSTLDGRAAGPGSGRPALVWEAVDGRAYVPRIGAPEAAPVAVAAREREPSPRRDLEVWLREVVGDGALAAEVEDLRRRLAVAERLLELVRALD